MSRTLSANRALWPAVHHTPYRHLAADPAVRAVAAIGLIAVGIIHALEIQGQLDGAVWLTAGFAALTIIAPIGALWLLARPAPLAWASGGLICLSAALGYILTRSVGLPGDPQDIGNWLEPLGLVALITEWIVVILAVLALAGHSGASRDTLGTDNG